MEYVRTQVKIPAHIWQEFKAKAALHNMLIKDYLTELITQDVAPMKFRRTKTREEK